MGRNYLNQTQELDIYGVSANYQGPACIIHGSEDGIVPLWCSEKYNDIYSGSELHIVEGENHLIIKKRREVIGIIFDFLQFIARNLTKNPNSTRTPPPKPSPGRKSHRFQPGTPFTTGTGTI